VSCLETLTSHRPLGVSATTRGVAVGSHPGSASRALRGHRHLGRWGGHPHQQPGPHRYHSADPGTSSARSRCRSAGVAAGVV